MLSNFQIRKYQSIVHSSVIIFCNTTLLQSLTVLKILEFKCLENPRIMLQDFSYQQVQLTYVFFLLLNLTKQMF